MTVIARNRLQIELGESKIAVLVKVTLTNIGMLVSVGYGRDQLLGSYSFTAPKTVSIPYESETNGLTPIERVVEVKIGDRRIVVFVTEERIDRENGTLQVLVVPHPTEPDSFIVDFGGEVFNDSRRIKVEKGLIPQVA